MLASAFIGSTLPGILMAVGWRELLAAVALKEVAEAAGVEDMDLGCC